MARSAGWMRMPPPLADTSAMGPELLPCDASPHAPIHYLEHGSDSPLIRWHHHASYELHLIVASQGLAYIGDAVNRFEAYSLVLVGPHVPHNWVSDPALPAVPLRDRVLQFSAAFLDQCAGCLEQPRRLTQLREHAAYGVEFAPQLAYELSGLFARISRSEGLRRVAWVFELLAALLEAPEWRRLSQRAFKAPARGEGAQLIDRVIDYIQTHYARDISLGQFAAELRMSDSAFSRLFQRYSGYGFSDYLNQTRIRHACEQLAAGPNPITQICFAVGYSNLSNFNRRFLALTGLTPREYRLRYRRS